MNLATILPRLQRARYLKLGKDFGLEHHPARFPEKLPRFFIRMLTDPGDLVVDIFAGSNTAGFVAEPLQRTIEGEGYRRRMGKTDVLCYSRLTIEKQQDWKRSTAHLKCPC